MYFSLTSKPAPDIPARHLDFFFTEVFQLRHHILKMCSIHLFHTFSLLPLKLRLHRRFHIFTNSKTICQVITEPCRCKSCRWVRDSPHGKLSYIQLDIVHIKQQIFDPSFSKTQTIIDGCLLPAKYRTLSIVH